jgi:hypothetical protein
VSTPLSTSRELKRRQPCQLPDGRQTGERLLPFGAIDGNVDLHDVASLPWTAARTLLLQQALDPVDRLFPVFVLVDGQAFERLDRGSGRALCLQIDLEELTQIERVLDVNNLQTVSSEIVEAARDSLVIGQS